MATIVLDYDVSNVQAQKALDFILSLDIFKVKKKITGIEKAFENIEEGQVALINGQSVQNNRRIGILEGKVLFKEEGDGKITKCA